MFILGTYVQTGCLATPSSTTSRPANKTALADSKNWSASHCSLPAQCQVFLYIGLNL
jgi:hypothetical protein